MVSRARVVQVVSNFVKTQEQVCMPGMMRQSVRLKGKRVWMQTCAQWREMVQRLMRNMRVMEIVMNLM